MTIAPGWSSSMREDMPIKNGRMPKRFLTAAIVAALACPALAQGHGLPPVPSRDGTAVAGDDVPDRVEHVLGGDVTLRPDGLYRVETSAGLRLTTHGPDYRRHMITDEDGDGVADLSNGPERPPACAASPASDHYQQVLYAYPTVSGNNLAANRADLQAQIRRNNWLLNDQSLASGGPEADFRVLCDGGSQISVTAFPVPLAATSATFDQVVTAAVNAGFANPRVDYSIFFDGTGACGFGHISSDDSPGVSNINNSGGDYGITYRSCWYSRASMHENAHNQGAVQYNAPNSTGNHWHCNQTDDVLCYVDGGDKNQFLVACNVQPGIQHFDCGWDDYFDSQPEPGEYLSNHWNIGSRVNRFVVFGSDTRYPTTTIVGAPSGTTQDATLSFVSSEEPSTFDCSLTAPGVAPSYSPCTSPQAYPGLADGYPGLADGQYEFRVRARDTAGNLDPTPPVREFTYDGPPDTTINSHPKNLLKLRNKKRRAKVTYSFAASDSVATFQCALDGGAYDPCSSPHATRAGRGAHSFAVVATDATGHADPSPASDSFKVKRKRR